MKFLLRFLLLSSALFLAHVCLAADEVSLPIGNIEIPSEKITTEDAQKAIMRALNNRKWTIREESADRVVAYLRRHTNEAQITFVITGRTIEISCWGYDINRNTGERKKPELPASWIKYIKADLSRFLNEVAMLK